MPNKKTIQYVRVLLRVGLAFVFIYAAVSMYIVPESFMKYIPHMMTMFMPLDLFVHAFGIFEIVLSIWLLSGWKDRWAAWICAFLLVGIVVFNTAYFSVLFRNIAIITGAVALALLDNPNQSRIRIKKRK